ncbi:Phosphatidylserine decarboxylase proenzyme 1 [Lasiodiplodia theobromae]|uniref:Phosphatidylserine decarboxylase proenzyme 1, mitochondrial n=1 Tax=Lasiodiplodia theobromae TaxID=45133 RepID=A0A5N5DIA1_9PEZI|nr:Phosphatidylserine decarboxylase proenzyme 1 [Lasiodiplodia theobromae]
MASSGIGLARPSHRLQLAVRAHPLRPRTAAPCSSPCTSRFGSPGRTFAASARRFGSSQRQNKDSFRSRLGEALRNTKIEWKPIPIALGVGFLGVFQFYRIQRDAKTQPGDDDSSYADSENGDGERPPKRKRIRPSGPWQVQVMSTLPLKALSRLWGRFNELDIPYYLRVPGFRLYSFIFGVNLDEMEEQDLHKYPNLAKFFYRTLKPGVRPIDPNPNAMVSPADGKVVQFGTIDNGEVEQVKGVTYSLDALLGSSPPSRRNSDAGSDVSSSAPSPHPSPERTTDGHQEIIKADEEFARVNGISYTLPNLFSGPPKGKRGEIIDQSTPHSPSTEAEVRADLELGKRPWWSPMTTHQPTALYYCVIYLAPGDYHRFHSPVSWVAESRRHFAGELYSVSPYLVRTLPGLFTLNERVAILGRWRWGFFSYVPVGATNVGSIVINFDRELRTNSLTTDTAADRAAAEAQKRGEAYSGYAEATYYGASSVLGGHALKKGEEMGGFQLGSTIVLVFEAPKPQRKSSLDEGFTGTKGGWHWTIEKGQKLKVGQAIGYVRTD